MPEPFTLPTIGEVLERRKPRSHTVPVPLDGELLDDIGRMDAVLAREAEIDEHENRPPRAPRLRAEIADLRQRAAESVVEFTFRELPRKVYRDLKAAHPSEDPHEAWDEDGFAPALIAACCVQPAMTVEDATKLWEEWSEGQTTILFGAALIVNEGPTRVPFGVSGSSGTNGSARN